MTYYLADLHKIRRFLLSDRHSAFWVDPTFRSAVSYWRRRLKKNPDLNFDNLRFSMGILMTGAYDECIGEPLEANSAGKAAVADQAKIQLLLRSWYSTSDLSKLTDVGYDTIYLLRTEKRDLGSIRMSSAFRLTDAYDRLLQGFIPAEVYANLPALYAVRNPFVHQQSFKGIADFNKVSALLRDDGITAACLSRKFGIGSNYTSAWRRKELSAETLGRMTFSLAVRYTAAYDACRADDKAKIRSVVLATADFEKIKALLDSKVTAYQIARVTGIEQTEIGSYRRRKKPRDLLRISFRNARRLTLAAEILLK